MTSAISGITAAMSGMSGMAGLTGIGDIAGTAGITAPGTTQSASGADFASILAGTVDQLQSAHSTADNLAAQAATGDLQDVSDYMIASQEASLATETVVTLKNSAVSAFTEIMRMSV